MNIAVAQISPIDGDVQHNLNEHYKLIKLAAKQGARLIAFPEMSVTGYVRERANELSFSENDSRLNKLHQLAAENNIIIIAGAPIKLASGLHIGEFIIFPDKNHLIYTKQFLHTGEEEVFSSNYNHNPLIRLGNECISLAICADITNPLHPENAKAAGATVYIAGIAFSEKSINVAHNLLSSYAQKHSMTVLMANFCGESWKTQVGGRSGVWSQSGSLISELNGTDSGLVIARKISGEWTGEVILE